MPTQTENNHGVYDNDLYDAENRNKKQVETDALSNKEKGLVDSQSVANKSPKINQFFNNAKVTLRRNPKKSAGLGFGLLGMLSAVYLGTLSLGPLEVITLSENLKNTFLILIWFWK